MGLGVLRHFRMVIDTRQELVRLSPGPSLAVLGRLGIEIDARNGAPTITRVVEGRHDWQKPLREGDIVRAVEGRRVTTRDEALRALADAGATVRITVERKGNRITRKLVLQ